MIKNLSLINTYILNVYVFFETSGKKMCFLIGDGWEGVVGRLEHNTLSCTSLVLRRIIKNTRRHFSSVGELTHAR